MATRRIEVLDRTQLQRSSGRHDAEAPDKWLGNDELVIDDFQGQRRQTARSGTVDDRRALARIVPRIVTGAFEDLLVVYPTAHLATRMRTDRRIGDHSIGRTLPRGPNERCRIEANQKHLVEPGTVTDEPRCRLHRPSDDLRPGNVPRRKAVWIRSIDG